eukprot:TRINITY_DN4582_c0_g1_i1.p1 TRINITY_DN4582_c0_g1~~TRINITY_DN4582_c0_g1_i1.p1  ORF type:complete len:155 (+),score=40.61 TRINITY_DN4582_c0_g1_i1:147-611(+)
MSKEKVDYSDDGRLLLDAAKRGNMSLMTTLIKENSNMNPNPQDGLGNTPLHYSAQAGHADTATMLLKDLKANPNVANFAGDTPLHKAVSENHLNMIKLLVESGAKVDTPNKKKQKPTDMCKSKDAKNILAMPQKVKELDIDLSDIADEGDVDSD